jgi:hypothetical protein
MYEYEERYPNCVDCGPENPLFENINYPKEWYYKSYHPIINQYDYNMSSTYTNIDMEAGYYVWGADDRVENTVLTSMPTTPGNIYHMAPTEEYWIEFGENQKRCSINTNETFDSNGIEMNWTNYMTCTQYIQSAIIMYNPPEYSSYFSSLSETQKTKVIGHEIGHALGFGHVTTTNSIMVQGQTGYWVLQPFDIKQFSMKY